MSRKTFLNLVALIFIAAVAFWAVTRSENIWAATLKLVGVLSPLFIGFLIAYVLNPAYKFFQDFFKHFIAEKDREKKRGFVEIIALLAAYVLGLGVMALLFSVVIPQMYQSVTKLVSNVDTYSKSTEAFYSDLSAFFARSGLILPTFPQLVKDVTGSLTRTGDMFSTIFNFTQSAVKLVSNSLVGLVVSVYLLLGKGHLKRQINGVLYAYLPQKGADRILGVFAVVNETFSSFIAGQMIETFIMGTMCFIGMSIFGFPYPVLISVIVGITNIIPVVGPIIGAFIGAVILLVASPWQAFLFLIMILVMQQVDGNIIYPRVVGNQVGLPAMWVLIAVFAGGGLFGIMGMFLAVPAASVIYKLLKQDATFRLRDKGYVNPMPPPEKRVVEIPKPDEKDNVRQ